jgi:hypothetical protein
MLWCGIVSELNNNYKEKQWKTIVQQIMEKMDVL